MIKQAGLCAAEACCKDHKRFCQGRPLHSGHLLKRETRNQSLSLQLRQKRAHAREWSVLPDEAGRVTLIKFSACPAALLLKIEPFQIELRAFAVTVRVVSQALAAL